MTESCSSASDVEPTAAVPGPPQAVLKCSVLWNLVRVPVWLFCRFWVRLEMAGAEHLDRQRGGLLLINHQSSLDPLLVAVLIDRPVSYLARDSLFRIPLLGWLLRKTHVIPLSRESVRGSSIRTALERLEQGYLVGIYPEGTRSSEEAVRRFRPGFLALARRTDQPIYPVGIAGSGQAFPRGSWWVRPRAVRVIFGAPFSDEDRLRLRDDKDDDALARLAHQRVDTVHQAALAWLTTGQRNPPEAFVETNVTPTEPR